MRWRASILPLLAAAMPLMAGQGATGGQRATGGSSASADAGATEAQADGPPAASADRPAARGSADSPAEDTQGAPRQLFAGRVVTLLEALKRRKISASEEELKGQVVLETPAGELIPIVPDWRGRAFFQDERLRDRTVELVGYRPPGTPYLKILMVFTFDEQGARQYTDYWCDICSIPMYEIQPCECCQGPVRLRFQPRELPEYLNPDPEEESLDNRQQPNAGEPRRRNDRAGRKQPPRERS